MLLLAAAQPQREEPTDDTGLPSLGLGGCEQKPELTPQFQIWCQSSMDWVKVEGGIKIPDQDSISAR